MLVGLSFLPVGLQKNYLVFHSSTGILFMLPDVLKVSWICPWMGN